MGCADLQRLGSTGQSHSPVLDAAPPGYPRPQSAGHRRILDAAVRRPRAGGAVSCLDLELHTHLFAAAVALATCGDSDASRSRIFLLSLCPADLADARPL